MESHHRNWRPSNSWLFWHRWIAISLGCVIFRSTSKLLLQALQIQIYHWRMSLPNIHFHESCYEFISDMSVLLKNPFHNRWSNGPTKPLAGFCFNYSFTVSYDWFFKYNINQLPFKIFLGLSYYDFPLNWRNECSLHFPSLQFPSHFKRFILHFYASLILPFPPC